MPGGGGFTPKGNSRARRRADTEMCMERCEGYYRLENRRCDRTATRDVRATSPRQWPPATARSSPTRSTRRPSTATATSGTAPSPSWTRTATTAGTPTPGSALRRSRPIPGKTSPASGRRPRSTGLIVRGLLAYGSKSWPDCGNEHVRERGLRPFFITLLTALAAGTTTLLTSGGVADLAYRSPSLHVALETAVAVISVVAALLVFGRFRQGSKLNDLLLFYAFAAFAISNLLLSALPAAPRARAAASRRRRSR